MIRGAAQIDLGLYPILKDSPCVHTMSVGYASLGWSTSPAPLHGLQRTWSLSCLGLQLWPVQGSPLDPTLPLALGTHIDVHVGDELCGDVLTTLI